MKYLTGRSRKLKVGNQYYFVDTDFTYPTIKTPTIKKETVYRIVTGDFSTKEKYERYFGFTIGKIKTDKKRNVSMFITSRKRI